MKILAERTLKERTQMKIDLSSLEDRHIHDLIASCIIPRPIAWVSTINRDGKPNLAPFSFFTGVSWSPPILAFSPVNRADGSKKDTVINIEEVPEFVIHIVSTDLLHDMEASAKPIPYGDDEFSLSRISFIPSETIKPYRIQEAKAAFECRLEKIVSINDGPNAGNLIIGRVQLFHIRDDILVNGRESALRFDSILGRSPRESEADCPTTIETWRISFMRRCGRTCENRRQCETVFNREYTAVKML